MYRDDCVDQVLIFPVILVLGRLSSQQSWRVRTRAQL